MNTIKKGEHKGFCDRSNKESDPLSPLLFVLVMDVLSTILSKAVEGRFIQGEEGKVSL